MTLNEVSIVAHAVKQLAAFRKRVAGIPYECKGVLYSEAFFLFLCAQAAVPKRILESGRARGQSTLLLCVMFPDRPVMSVECDADSPDTAVAEARLRGRTNVMLRFGDATRLLPAEARDGDIALIDGPKGFRGVRLALRLLATGKIRQVFMHDCCPGSPERAFLDAHLPGVLYSDAPAFARVAHVLDAVCRSEIPPERRFANERAPRAGYGYSLACMAFNPSVRYRWLLARAVIAGFRARLAKRRTCAT